MGANERARTVAHAAKGGHDAARRGGVSAEKVSVFSCFLDIASPIGEPRVMKKRPARARLRARSSKKLTGAPPGLLEVATDATPGTLRVFNYNEGSVEEGTPKSVADLRAMRQPGKVLWVDLDGLVDRDLVSELGQCFGLHPLTLEDAVNTEQRPKAEEYDFGLFVVARMPHMLPDGGMELEQLSVFLGDGFVLTLQERPGDCLDAVRNRIRDGRGRIRKLGADYLAYAILDAVVDAYFPLVEHEGERLDALEDHILDDEPTETPRALWSIKRELIHIRRALLPLRDAVSHVIRSESPRLTDDTRLYLRDVVDHGTRLAELVESYRDVASGLVDVHLSLSGNKMNEIMKVLTIIATIFIPLSFVAGVYGMNFDGEISRFNMPELRWVYGYPFALGIMGTIGVGLLGWFRRKRWI